MQRIGRVTREDARQRLSGIFEDAQRDQPRAFFGRPRQLFELESGHAILSAQLAQLLRGEREDEACAAGGDLGGEVQAQRAAGAELEKRCA